MYGHHDLSMVQMLSVDLSGCWCGDLVSHILDSGNSTVLPRRYRWYVGRSNFTAVYVDMDVEDYLSPTA